MRFARKTHVAFGTGMLEPCCEHHRQGRAMHRGSGHALPSASSCATGVNRAAENESYIFLSSKLLWILRAKLNYIHNGADHGYLNRYFKTTSSEIQFYSLWWPFHFKEPDMVHLKIVIYRIFIIMMDFFLLQLNWIIHLLFYFFQILTIYFFWCSKGGKIYKERNCAALEML